MDRIACTEGAGNQAVGGPRGHRRQAMEARALHVGQKPLNVPRRPGVGQLQPSDQIWCVACFREALLERSHARSFLCCLWLISGYTAEWNGCARGHPACGVRYLLPSRSQRRKFANPCGRQWGPRMEVYVGD